MPKAIVVPPGTVFGRLTAIEAARSPHGLRAMLCRCECGRPKVVTVSSLRAGYAKSCGYCGREIRVTASRGEIPLYGKNARGRVALIDEENYELASQYRWRVQERVENGKVVNGPYAVAHWKSGGKVRFIFMHTLLTGWARVDHKDHDGLNNQRSNLREATTAQNAQNKRKSPGFSSQYKGVYLDRGRWRAVIRDNGKMRYLGYFPDEETAAHTYDAAAREAFGEFACTNFAPGSV